MANKTLVQISTLIVFVALVLNKDRLLGPEIATNLMVSIAGWQIGTWAFSFGNWLSGKLR